MRAGIFDCLVHGYTRNIWKSVGQLAGQKKRGWDGWERRIGKKKACAKFNDIEMDEN